MDGLLKERALKLLALSDSGARITNSLIKEIGEVHYLLTSRKTDCTACKVYGLLNEIRAKVNPIIPNIKTMANDKGQFKANATELVIIRHTPAGTKVITPENLNTGNNFEWVLNSFPHLVEVIETTKVKTETAGEPAKVKSK